MTAHQACVNTDVHQHLGHNNGSRARNRIAGHHTHEKWLNSCLMADIILTAAPYALFLLAGRQKHWRRHRAALCFRARRRGGGMRQTAGRPADQV